MRRRMMYADDAGSDELPFCPPTVRHLETGGANGIAVWGHCSYAKSAVRESDKRGTEIFAATLFTWCIRPAEFRGRRLAD